MADDGFKRKLAAILSADVEGYSRLMDDEEEATVRTITSYRNVITDLTQQFRGRVIDSPGDNILADFTSVVDAVNCAVEIQRDLAERNAELPDNRKMKFRIGVNLGDVIDEDGRIYGDGVNIAARVESLAEAGGICISGRAHDQVENKLGLEYEDLGKHEVKNISRPIQVYRVLSYPGAAAHRVVQAKESVGRKWRNIGFAAGGAFAIIAAVLIISLYFKYWNMPTPEKIDPEDTMAFELPKGPAIAVLPFVNMTGDQEFEYFCDGVTRNVISSLSYIPEAFLIAYNSTSAYKGKQVNTQQIGKDLGARYIIEGSIQKAVDRIRILVNLIDAKSGLQKWSKTYDRQPDDIIKLQDDIAFEILRSLNLKIKSSDLLRKQYKEAYNFDEYKKYLRGWHNLSSITPETNSLAQIAAIELIAKKPDNPLAYSLLARTYVMDLMSGRCDSPVICLGKGTEAVRKALSLDNNSSVAHETAGLIFLMRKEHENAIDSLKMAISLNPSNAYAYNNLGFVFIYADELVKAIDYIKKAIRLNPIPPSWYYFCLGFAYQNSKQFDKAIAAYKKCLEINPDNWATLVGMVVVYGHMGDKEKAKDAISELYRVRPNFSKSHFLKTNPYKIQSSRDFIGEGLTKAGIAD
jgi:TolB-like protein/class 3 adenylate cyclase